MRGEFFLLRVVIALFLVSVPATLFEYSFPEYLVGVVAVSAISFAGTFFLSLCMEKMSLGDHPLLGRLIALNSMFFLFYLWQMFIIRNQLSVSESSSPILLGEAARLAAMYFLCSTFFIALMCRLYMPKSLKKE